MTKPQQDIEQETDLPTDVLSKRIITVLIVAVIAVSLLAVMNVYVP
ncbi:MAG: hypothetical protein WD407_00940 [Rhodospirillales bacterium]